MKTLFFSLFLWCFSLQGKIILPDVYPGIIEQLIYFKDENFKAFYGGPVDHGVGVKWVMPVLFENAQHQVRSVYEISFINCLPNATDAKEAEIAYIKVSDIDLKFHNKLSEEYKLFSDLINNEDPRKKYILIREADVINIYYPEIFISTVYSEFYASDKNYLLHFLQTKFQTSGACRDLTYHEEEIRKRSVDNVEGLIEQKKVGIEMDGKIHPIIVNHYYFKDDPWKSYYVASLDYQEKCDSSEVPKIFLRLDSGCNSGQIYHDKSCDCLEQLQQGLESMLRAPTVNSLLIHIPAHDGRGFGIAPKAETEIYKRGGIGRVNQSEKLDTIQAAILLYRSPNYDIRTYTGCIKILALNKIKEVELLTDNRHKIAALVSHGIAVRRKKTDTQKASCLNHIKAKKDSQCYFAD